MQYLNVKSHQENCLENILSSCSDAVTGHWKILIYDENAKTIISPVLSVQKLRKLGVTLHMAISSKRDPVPEVPVIYLIEPSKENIYRIKNDCERNLYDEIHIHFTEPATEDILNFLASSIVQCGSASKVKRVFNQFIKFLSLEQDLFSLTIKNSFSSYNLPSLQESAVMSYMDGIATGLINVFTTLKILPIIRCPRGGPAELLSKILTKRLRMLHKDSSYQEAFFLKETTKPSAINLEEIALSSKRSLILIADRGVDMSSMLFHSSRYQTLVDDLQKIDLNRVKIIPTESNSKPKIYSLDSDNDEFWKEYAGKMIPEAVEKHAIELQTVSTQITKIKSQTGTNDQNSSSILLKTVESLPKIIEKKKILEMHLEIIKNAMILVSEREIYNYAEIEEKMITRQYGEVKEVKKLLVNQNLKFEDKARLVAVFLLTAKAKIEDNNNVFDLLQKAKESVEKFTSKQDEALKTVLYIRKLQSLTSRFVPSVVNNDKDSMGLWNFADKAAQGFLDARKKVKGMVFSESLFPVVQMLDIVTKPVILNEELKGTQGNELLYFDPKIGESETPKFQRQHNEIKAGIVFVLGGGCYAEYQNLKEYCYGEDKTKPKKRFLYGCTEMLNATEFMAQVAACYKSK